jgi:hypothetical protein
MDRRSFLKASGVVSVASLSAVAAPPVSTAQKSDAVTRPQQSLDTVSTWHFLDLWRFDHFDNLSLRQGQPEWRDDAVYCEPHVGSLSAWPTVFRHEETGRWRMLYSADWKPYSLMIAESEDGVHWQPLPQPGINPVGGKRAPHHLFTLLDGSGGAVYHDPVADDGFPFKVFVHQHGKPVLDRAIADPTHRWHTIAKVEGEKRYLADEFTLVSRDGLNWESQFDMQWSQADWHPEPPIFGFFNHHLGRHQMTVRPGWGDRRQCIQSTSDFRTWSGPELLLQPDTLDEELIELYGMPVFRYGDGYVGLPWIFHCESTEPTRGFNRFIGPLDCQLAFSSDGNRFTRGLRTPFIPCNESGQHGGGAIQPSCLVETDDEIRIYSAATKLYHGEGRKAKRLGVTDNASILLHTLRKDGLMYLESQGDWGRFISKPLVLLEDSLKMNAAAPHGEIQFQLTDMESQPVEGFTFADCLPLSSTDSVDSKLEWKNVRLKDVVGRIVRLEVRLRHAKLFAIRGSLHFIDAQDRWMLEDGKSIAT